jgi:hypothetical protein
MKIFPVCGLIVLMALFSCIESHASFEMGRLIQVVYKSDDVEVATDLLDVDVFDFTQQNIQLTPAGTFNLGQFTSTNAWEDLKSGFFAHYADLEVGEAHAWFATTQPTAPAISESSLGGYFGSAGPTQTYYDTLSDTITAIGDPSYPNSYWVKMNSRTSPGQYGGYNTGYETSPGSGQNEKLGESNLGALETIGYVDMYLYHFSLNALVPGPGGTPYTAVLRLLSNGSTVLNPIAGTVPPVINEVQDVTIGTARPYDMQVTLSEGHSPDLIWTLVGPDGMTIDGNGRVFWPEPTETGSPHTVTVQVENGEGSDDTSWVVTVIEGYTPPTNNAELCRKVASEVVGKTFVTKLGGELFDVRFSESIVSASCPMGGVEIIDWTFGSLGSFGYDTVPDFNVAGLKLRMEGEIIVQDIPDVLVLQFNSPNEFAVYSGADLYEGTLSGSSVTVKGKGASWDFSSSAEGSEALTIEGIRFQRLFRGFYATAPVLILELKD